MKLKILILLIGIFLITAMPALAENDQCGNPISSGADWLNTIGVEGGRFIPIECSDSCPKTECTLNSAFKLIINFTQVLFALTGSIAILMFVFGGTMMIVGGAAGDQTQHINRGKDAIKGAVIGLAVMLGAWLIVNFTILAITQGGVGTKATIFGRPFNEAPSAAPGKQPEQINDPQN